MSNPSFDRSARTDGRQRRAFQRIAFDPLGALGLTIGNGLVFDPTLHVLSALVDPVANNMLTLSTAGLKVLSGLTTKGDLFTYGTSNARLGVGTNGQILTPDSAQTTGLKWVTRTLTAGTGLTGGGDLSADRSFAADFGTTAGKITEGNDARLLDTYDKSNLNFIPPQLDNSLTNASPAVDYTYALYHGRTTRQITVQYVSVRQGTAGGATSTVSGEVGIASSSGPPDKAAKTLTVLAAGELDGSLIGVGSNTVHRNFSAFNYTVPKNTYLWSVARWTVENPET